MQILPVTEATEQVPEFVKFGSIPRITRECVVTEKIDGTNASIHITEDGRMYAGSRTRWITPENDNHGFARWVQQNFYDLLTLGPGTHYGEWWGNGIQRGYGLTNGDKRFSLFNVGRWRGPEELIDERTLVPACVSVVPVLWRGLFDTRIIDGALFDLEETGSVAAPGFMKPEGIVVYHEAGKVLFKKTLEGDGHKTEGVR